MEEAEHDQVDEHVARLCLLAGVSEETAEAWGAWWDAVNDAMPVPEAEALHLWPGGLPTPPDEPLRLRETARAATEAEERLEARAGAFLLAMLGVAGAVRRGAFRLD